MSSSNDVVVPGAAAPCPMRARALAGRMRPGCAPRTRPAEDGRDELPTNQDRPPPDPSGAGRRCMALMGRAVVRVTRGRACCASAPPLNTGISLDILCLLAANPTHREHLARRCRCGSHSAAAVSAWER